MQRNDLSTVNISRLFVLCVHCKLFHLLYVHYVNYLKIAGRSEKMSFDLIRKFLRENALKFVAQEGEYLFVTYTLNFTFFSVLICLKIDN